MKKISVITPMYNSETFIAQCVRSIQNQSEQNWEMVIIDDGSTDQGPAICEEMSRGDDRIRLYRQENRGVSCARNRGLDLAEGKYVFFLDSDDTIHHRLLEEMLKQAEGYGCGLLFCGYTLSDGSLSTLKETCNEEMLHWQFAKEEEVQEWFHMTHVNEMSGIGGKMINRRAIGSLRFDVSLINGEDTYFLYCLICQGIRASYSSLGWYYYRMHQESVTHSVQTIRGNRYYESSRRIRDGEYKRGNTAYSLTWESIVVEQIKKNYAAQRKSRDKEGTRRIRRIAREEIKHPMFRQLYLINKIFFVSCFVCYPLYRSLRNIASILRNNFNIVSASTFKDFFFK